CWTHVQQMSHGPSPASSPLHLASVELRRTRFQYAPSPKPILRDIWLYDCNLASTAQDSVLNCQCGLLLTIGHAALTRQGLHEQGSPAHIGHTKGVFSVVLTPQF